MPKSLVGRVKNKKFAFFWLLISGSIVNIIIALRSPNVWPVFLPPAVLSILIAIAIADSKHRPRIWLGIDLILTLIMLVLLMPAQGVPPMELAILLPDALIVLGCVLGVMNW